MAAAPVDRDRGDGERSKQICMLRLRTRPRARTTTLTFAGWIVGDHWKLGVPLGYTTGGDLSPIRFLVRAYVYCLRRRMYSCTLFWNLIMNGSTGGRLIQ